MGIERKRSLPLLDVLAPESVDARPSLETARRRMGGRARSAGGVGRLVRLDGDVGVLVFASDAEDDVWIERGVGSAAETGVVRRAKAGVILPFTGDAPPSLQRVAIDIQMFATIAEGDSVRYEAADGVMAEGRLLEKCRFGALVAAPDGRILAVGFRKLWPVASSGATS